MKELIVTNAVKVSRIITACLMIILVVVSFCFWLHAEGLVEQQQLVMLFFAFISLFLVPMLFALVISGFLRLYALSVFSKFLKCANSSDIATVTFIKNHW